MCRAEIASAAFVSVAHDIIEKESSRQVPVTSLLSVTVLSQRDDLEQAEKLATVIVYRKQVIPYTVWPP